MNEKLINVFKRESAMTADKAHAAACAIFEVLFGGNLDKWNAPQDEKWTRKYNKGLVTLANAGLVTLTVL